MNFTEEFYKWQKYENLDEENKSELLQIEGNEAELRERFSKHLEFGTAGLRGIMGAGINRINIYTIRRATQGLCDYIKSKGSEAVSKGVVIAYDTRNHSDSFALEAALVIAGNGIKTYLFSEPRPTPHLSFAVRYLKTISGIVITSSHNPKEYNGYKVYWDDGGQIPPHISDEVLKHIENTDIFGAVSMNKESAFKNNLIVYLGKELDDAFIEAVLKQKTLKSKPSVSIVYTPLHGTGSPLAERVLSEAGFEKVFTVEAQAKPDGNFPTAPYPNPEVDQCYELAVKEAKKRNADIILATDPDADRVGICVRGSDGVYKRIYGNQVGALLTEYVLSQKKLAGNLPKNSAVISTIVSTRLTQAICSNYGVDYMDVYTGFKFIAEKILLFEQTNSNQFIMGWEESYGYLIGTHARDKDAMVACLLIAEMCDYYHSQNKTLLDALEDLFIKYGYYIEGVVNIVKHGLDGAAKIQNIMEDFRRNPPHKIDRFNVLYMRDYKNQIKYNLRDEKSCPIKLPPANVLYFEMDEGMELAVRPSGTEPKLKFYIFAKSDKKTEAEEKTESLRNYISKTFE